jgi:hypothetical protein
LNKQKKESIIVFCTTLRGAKKINITDNKRDYFLVSDDKRVHNFCKSKFDSISCHYKDQGYSQYSVSNQVKIALDLVNNWFKLVESSIPNFPENTLFWENHAEGGQTTQRIQDCFLLFNSFTFLIDSISPKEIIIINDNPNLWENSLIETCANKLNIKVKYIKVYSYIFFLKSLYTRFRPLFKEILFSLRIIHSWVINSRKKLHIDKERAILIQLCDSSTKHIDHTEPLVKAINEVGLQGIVFGWGAKHAINGLTKKGLSAFELENFVSLKNLIYSWRYAFLAWNAAKNSIHKLQLNLNGDDNKKIIDIVINHSLKSFFLGDVANRLRLKSASYIFFSFYSIKAIRLWTRVLPQSIIVYNSLPIPNNIIFFWQPGWPYNIDEPLKKYMVPADIIFALSYEHKRILLSEGISESQIVVVGLPWIEKINNFSTTYTKEFSRNKIGLQKNGFKYIFFDPGYVLLGFMNLSEQLSQLFAILEFAKVNLNVIILIKPHPAYREGIIEEITRNYNLKNVYFFPPNSPLYHILNSSDLLITKMSTLAIEAMFLNIPTIANIFHPEKKFMYYEDAVEYAFTTEELTNFLNKFISDSEYTDKWRKNLNIHIKKYLSKHGLNNKHTDPNLVIANTLKQIVLNKVNRQIKSTS